ncbi:MAG: A/G-specific adenine glycosylase [Chloroflexota bacterium]|nr:A/G-specific adenine glycosylase [Chloroflexota bacterium]
MNTRPVATKTDSRGHANFGVTEPAAIEAVQEALLGWFAANRRDLPWRHTRDPWAILVSEVMLQQIQVVRAIPFYHAFLRRFPTVQSLADAPLADAIRVWGDLGRYKRVVNLHRSAQLIVKEHGGQVPSEPEVLGTLPGIGPYTAGAVACFAFERDAAFADTNMRRVLHRVFVGVDVPRPIVTDRVIAELAQASVPPGRGWEWNHGLMEFGALHCTARRPACATCPVQGRCRAYPAIGAALVADRGRVGEKRPSYRYEESNRYYRGRVLARLREQSVGDDAARGVDLGELGEELRPGFTESDVPWLTEVVGSLERDGLAVAEERPIYDAGAASPANKTEVRVRLP